ncbi:MAG: hypothetical protein R3E98_18705 [Gemmatimonadota bacterium]
MQGTISSITLCFSELERSVRSGTVSEVPGEVAEVMALGTARP